MRSIAETEQGKMALSPIQQQRRIVGVVLRHRAASAACACLTLDAAATAAYCTPEGAVQIRAAHS